MLDSEQSSQNMSWGDIERLKEWVVRNGRTLFPFCALRTLKTCSVSCFVGSAMIVAVNERVSLLSWPSGMSGIWCIQNRAKRGNADSD